MVSEKEAFYWWFTGFVEAQGSFTIGVYRPKNGISPKIHHYIRLTSHKRDLPGMNMVINSG